MREVTSRSRRQQPGSRSTMGRHSVMPIILLLPAIAFFVLLVYYPIVQAFIMSFFRWNLYDDVHKFLGLGNYQRLLNDPNFMISVRNTAVYTFFTVVVGTILALFFAVLLNRKLRLNSLYRFAYIVPIVIPVVTSAVVWEWLFHPSQGLINYFLSFLGVGRIGWLVDPRYALTAVIIVGIWGHLGFDMIIFLAGLKGIPTVYYDAAKVDGASHWQQVVNITLPELRPVILFVMVVATIRSFEVFGQVYVLTAGGPMRATSTMVYGIYTAAFRSQTMGYASAMAFFLFGILLMLSVIQMRMGRESE